MDRFTVESMSAESAPEISTGTRLEETVPLSKVREPVIGTAYQTHIALGQQLMAYLAHCMASGSEIQHTHKVVGA